MKIVIVNRHVQDYLGGSEMQCDLIARRLHELGHEILYVAPQALKNVYDTKYRTVPVNASAISISACIKEFSPDVVYWRLNKYHFRRTAKRVHKLSIPFVFAISHIDDTRKLNRLSNPKNGLRFAIKAAKQSLINLYNYGGFKYVSAVTSLNPDYLGILPVEKQSYVPNCVDVSAISFNWPRPFVVWVANIKTAKRPEVFLRLADNMRHTGVDFLMVGEILSSEYEWLKSVGLDNFYYLGSKSPTEVNGILKESMFLVHTCLPEGFGNNFLQAWFAGVPTVSLSFDPGGYIRDNSLGYISDGSEKCLAKQVELLIFNSDMRDKLGSNGRIFANASFGLDKTVESLLELFSDIVAIR